DFVSFLVWLAGLRFLFPSIAQSCPDAELGRGLFCQLWFARGPLLVRTNGETRGENLRHCSGRCCIPDEFLFARFRSDSQRGFPFVPKRSERPLAWLEIASWGSGADPERTGTKTGREIIFDRGRPPPRFGVLFLLARRARRRPGASAGLPGRIPGPDKPVFV